MVGCLSGIPFSSSDALSETTALVSRISTGLMNPFGTVSIKSATRNETVRSILGSNARASAGGNCDGRVFGAEVVIFRAPSSNGVLFRGAVAVAAAERNGSGADDERVAFG